MSGSGGDGRYVDPELGLLLGEAASQRIEATSAREVWRDVATSLPAPGEGPTYYDRPVLKEPVWIWSVPVYFWVGGTMGAALTLGGAAQLAGGPELRPLVRRCRWVGAVGGAASAALLVHDLGRPERFHHMLRVFRPTSPMSVGSWVLAGASTLAGAAALLASRRGLLRGAGDLAGLGAALLGLPLAGYTAVLVGNTAVPLWLETRRTLPLLFIASAMGGAASFFDLAPASRPREKRVVRAFGAVGKVVELAAMVAVERQVTRIERVGRPLREGVSGALWSAAKALTVASLGATILPRRTRRAALAAGLLGTAGALALRFAVFHAGKASSRDPRATFDQQRGR
ncbi:MAG TPA: NrfD/PsrC family molybdoenzyme membrane anchor subunit [Thermoanaerobaculia bacterium]|nr:NrfD/PsrC family molybdoenzyme membrane anchor subunit [Thermoanaerobaculia bacterium]